MMVVPGNRSYDTKVDLAERETEMLVEVEEG